jgi:hypothetical protein
MQPETRAGLEDSGRSLDGMQRTLLSMRAEGYELPVPPMPAELRLRCRSLVMLPAQARSARDPRRW